MGTTFDLRLKKKVINEPLRFRSPATFLCKAKSVAKERWASKYYLTGFQGAYAVTNFAEMQEVDFKDDNE